MVGIFTGTSGESVPDDALGRTSPAFRTRYAPDVDDLALRLYVLRVEQQLVEYVRATSAIKRDLDDGLLTAEMFVERRAMLAKLVVLGGYRRDDLLLLEPRSRVGRAVLGLARVLAVVARIVG